MDLVLLPCQFSPYIWVVLGSTDWVFDAFQYVNTAGAALLVLALHVQNLDFLHEFSPLSLTTWKNRRVCDRSSRGFHSLVGVARTPDVGVDGDGDEVEDRLVSTDGWRQRAINWPMLFELLIA
jgi:hypothetical protein